MNIISLGDLKIPIDDLFERYDSDPNTGLVWQRPDAIADMVTLAVDNPRKMEELFDLLEPAAILMSVPTRRTHWQHLNLGGVAPDARLYSLIMLHDPVAHLGQSDYNFLCGVDIPDARLSVSKVDDAVAAINQYPRPLDAQEFYRQKAIEDMTIDPQQKRLADAFVKMMIQEAEPHRPHILGGAFEMQRVPLPFLDRLVSYDSIRLVISPAGLRGSLIYGDKFSPWFWSPRRTSLFLKGAELAWALQVVSASIWRDACVVRHKFVTERRRSIYQPRRRQPRQQKAVTVLPRVIRHVVWSDDAERDRIIHQAHAVRQHYRELPPGWQTSSEATANAGLYGWPEPPAGYTFVKPHTRGGEADLPVARPVVCKGLQIAKIALG